MGNFAIEEMTLGNTTKRYTGIAASTISLADAFKLIEARARSDGASSLLQAHSFLASHALNFLNQARVSLFPSATGVEQTDLLWLNIADTAGSLGISATEAISLADPQEHSAIAFIALDDRISAIAVPAGATRFSFRPFPRAGLPGLNVRKLTLELDVEKFSLDSRLADGLREKLLLQLTGERWLFFSAVILGIAQSAFDYVLDYARKRTAFGKPIVHHQAVALKLADILTAIESSRLLCHEACLSGNAGASLFQQARRTWQYINEITGEIAPHIMQIMGGHGYLQDHPVQQWFCDLQLVSLMGELPGPFSDFHDD